MNSLYLPEHAARLVLRPGAKVGKGGNPHHYLVDGEKYQRVTTILDKTVPKPGLIPWATSVGVERMGQLVYDEQGALTGPENQWAGQLNEMIAIAKAEPDRVKDAAADWGTGAHKWIQTEIEGRLGAGYHGMPPPEYVPVVNAFCTMAETLQIIWRATEMVVWSDALRVAGTVDAVGQLPDGSWILMDWKTGEYRPEKKGKDYHGGFFWPAENALQLAAYAALFTTVTRHEVAQAWVVRFPRNAPILCQHCDGFFRGEEGRECTCPPGFSARRVTDLESTALHFDMLVNHARWLAQSPWVKEA